MLGNRNGAGNLLFIIQHPDIFKGNIKKRFLSNSFLIFPLKMSNTRSDVCDVRLDFAKDCFA